LKTERFSSRELLYSDSQRLIPSTAHPIVFMLAFCGALAYPGVSLRIYTEVNYGDREEDDSARLHHGYR